MSFRPLDTYSDKELTRLCFDIVFEMYYRLVQGGFAVQDPPSPVVPPRNGPPFGRFAAPMAGFGTQNAFSTAGPTSGAPQHESNAMSWDQLYGLNQGAGAAAPFDVQAAPMGPGINVGQDQALNSLTNNYDFTPAHAALPQLATNDYGMNADWDSLFTDTYGGAAQGPLSPAQTQTPVMSPVSDYSMEDANSSDSSLFSPHMDVNGGLSDVHESGASIATSAFLDNY